MYTAVITRGKFQALDAGVLPPLLRLVESEDRAVCVNALRALTCLAEAPQGPSTAPPAPAPASDPTTASRAHHPESISHRHSGHLLDTLRENQSCRPPQTVCTVCALRIKERKMLLCSSSSSQRINNSN
ncbi:hypothetical protein AOLI_G00067690 [Acnodon oligacanthus]